MRDEQYCETMLEAYRDVLSELLNGHGITWLNDYIKVQIEFYDNWRKEELK
jgi:hypothetical protein